MKFKNVLFLFALMVISLPVNSQIAITPTAGTSFLYGMKPFVGAELQADGVSVTASWCPIKIGDDVYSNGFSLTGTYYFDAYTSSLFFRTTMLSYGRNNTDEVTNKPIKLMQLKFGYRFYPAYYYDNISKRLSFDLAVGAEICRNTTVRPCVEASVNFTVFQHKKRF